MEKNEELEQLKLYTQQFDLTPKEVGEYFLSKDIQPSLVSQSEQSFPEKYETPKIILPGMYVYADGLIYPEIIEGRQVMAVVGSVNGSDVLAVCLQEACLPWSYDFLRVEATRNMADGRKATSKILEVSCRTGKSAEAAQWCYDYVENGVKQGEAFLPSLDELEKMIPNVTAINASLKALGAVLLDGWYWSTTEYGGTWAWRLRVSDGYRDSNAKYICSCIRPVLKIQL